ncbi:SDR family NAD(P)-dependent oxidoreductase [Pengzhenrongella frigida]|uniref:SDR family oxidoreductase n=1 Tax=Pengzhenrongella frigida TaxID=1259133 RepID=A0A4Q5N529_9MICO|nr:SDR family NAD(P)-dependent oxidoreductase [Cellulomonas sp. HLT2-17]RYV51161.1 SDR family oxidoreductase [Cellulomonas sp. HLT2-17]
MDAGRFAGLTAIVTGAGSGIGRATALRLAAEGARVVACDLMPERVAETIALIAAEGAGVGVGAVGDITDQQHIDAIVADAGGRVDVLVNCAGIMDGFLPVGELDDATWERVLDVNLTSPMRTTRAVLPLMTAAGAGAIVNVASAAAQHGGASGTAYAASKHGVIGLTRSTAVLYRAAGIRCNAVLPGAVATNIGATAAPKSDYAMSVLGPLMAIIPPVAQPEELAAAICWLASPDARNVTGALLSSDGGWSAI